MPRYRLRSFLEPIRLGHRAFDFLFLICSILRLNHFGLTHFRSRLSFYPVDFVEFGPGPCRLDWLKSLLFNRTLYYDLEDFGHPAPNLVCMDFSGALPFTHLLGKPHSPEYLFFADHCFEHLPFSTILEFVTSCNSSFLFRVPNIRSTSGIKDYLADPTHQTMFSDEQISLLCAVPGVHVIPWSRLFTGGLCPFPALVNAREICVYRIVAK